MEDVSVIGNQEEMSYPVVEVSWRDAFFDYEGGEPRTDYLLWTVGYLIPDESLPDFLSVAAEILPSGHGFRAVTHIPTRCVLRIQVLRRAAG